MDLQLSENGVHGVSYNGSEVQLNIASLIAESKTEKEKKRKFLWTRIFENYSCNQLLTFCVLALADFFCYCCMSMLAPFFPNEAHKKGMSEFGSGLVFGFYALVMFVTSPIFGKFVRYSGEKLMFILGITLAGACNILFGSLKNVDNLMIFTFLCFLIRGLEALGSSAYATASFIYVINIFPNNIGKVCGILETIVGVGMSLGPVIGGALFSYGGFPLPFYTIGFLTLLVVPISFWLLPPSDSRRNIDGSFLELLRIKEVFATIIVIIVVSINWSFLDPILEPYLRQFDMSTNTIAFLFLLLTVTYAVFCPIWGWISDNKKLHWVLMTTGFFFSFISLLVIGPISSHFTPENPFTLLVLGLAFLGVSIALALLPTFDGIFMHANSSQNETTVTQGIVSGLWSSAYSLGQMIGPSFGGGAAEHYGFSTTTSIVAGLNFFTFLMSSVFLYKDLKRNRTHPGTTRTDVAQTQTETITNVNTTQV